MRALRSLCVYCGSSDGVAAAHVDAARRLGAVLARERVRLVYGGGGFGLMGAVARAALAGGGEVLGVVPEFLRLREGSDLVADREVVVPDMHTRKKLMFDEADAFAALPGGVGTLEELVEMLTWAQLGRHAKPIAIVNLDGFWDPLLALLEHMAASGFLRRSLAAHYRVVARIDDVLPALRGVDLPAPPADAAPLERL
jgi:hypothetical protein